MPDRSPVVTGLGALVIALAFVRAGQTALAGGSSLAVVLDFVLLGLPGVLFLYVGLWLSSSQLDPELYPRVVLWCLGGVAIMFVFLALRAIHPGVTTSFTFGTRAVALAIGSVAGLAIGIHEARALTRERELARRNDALERTQATLEERNEELSRTQAELEAALSRVEASNERLDHFASTASHDLKEPLRMISQYLTLIETRHAADLDEDAHEFLAFAVDGADRLRAMVDALLEYARVETGGTPLERVDLEAVLDEVLADLQMTIEDHGAAVTVDSPSLPRVLGDSGQLRQLFQNLLANAIEYCEDGPPRVHVSASQQESTVTISVRDEGIGIEPADSERIFELFERLHTVDEHPGTGIGLAVCQRIVERHGGDIWVDSVPGDGSTFSFTLRSSEQPSLSPGTSARPGS
ncbi:sensor histidine kinase [Natronobiforma cellulositropha]|uniref:sensor histidine kinase n=1 Tax=Natronobiforma cellulositropha TaxID=1679076 RepID=UPI0021D5B9C6|nr:ATP-binding protein [Natronobiforma cellulositropha]